MLVWRTHELTCLGGGGGGGAFQRRHLLHGPVNMDATLQPNMTPQTRKHVPRIQHRSVVSSVAQYHSSLSMMSMFCYRMGTYDHFHLDDVFGEEEVTVPEYAQLSTQTQSVSS